MNEADIIDRAIAVLRDNGIDASATRRDALLRGHRIGAVLRIRLGGRAHEYVAETKRQVTPATLGGILAQLTHLKNGNRRPGLLITEHVTPPLAIRLKELDTQFIDTTGNAYLHGPGMFVWVTGQQPDRVLHRATPRGALTAAGLKVLFALICDPALVNAPYRAIAEAAGVALGVITPVVLDLRTHGHLVVAVHTRRVVGTKRFLDEWATAYARTLRPKTLLQTFTANDSETWRSWDLVRVKAQWGGEPAARLLVGNLDPGVLTLYATGLPARLIVDHRMTAIAGAGREWPADSMLAVDDRRGAFRRRHAPDSQLIEIRNRFWGATLSPGAHRTVPPALIYADLLATGEARCLETARLIYDAHLARRFPID